MALSGDAAKAVAAVKSGQDPALAVYGESGQAADSSQVIEADDVDARDSASSLNDLLDDGDPSQAAEASTDSQETSGDGQKNASGTPKTGSDSSTEEVTISDDKGRRTVKVDFADREKMKKYVQMAHGARKWQAERDQERTGKAAAEKQLGELQGHWSNLEKAYRSRGIAGIVDLIDGQGSFEKWEQNQQARWAARQNASPEELALLDARDQAAARDRELAEIRRENDEFKKQVTGERETAELRAMESKIHPSFEKYRFAGTLGDANDEHMFDEMLWNTALKRLEPYEEKGLDITPELVEREFRATATAIRKRVQNQVETKVKSAVQKKKVEATENAQAAVMKGVKNTSAAREAHDMIQKGNITGLLKGWGRFGGVFNK